MTEATGTIECPSATDFTTSDLQEIKRDQAAMAEGLASEAPPSYASTSDPEKGAGSGGAPPTYDSMFGKLKAQKAESSGNVDLAKRVCGVFCATIGCTVLSVILLGIPIAMIVIGAIYLHDCPVQRFIPIYLIVAGSFGILSNTRCAIKSFKRNRRGDDEEEEDSKDFMAIVDLFLFAWLICGSVWVYRIYKTVQHDPQMDLYCQETVYKFAFGMITAAWSFVGLCFLLVCCGCCCLAASN